MKTLEYTGKWAGSVTFTDPLTLPQAAAWERAVAGAQKVLKEGAGMSAYNYAILAGICTCVEKWELKGLPERITPESFPAKPHKARAELVAWLVNCVIDLYKDADEIPNA